MWFVVGIAIGYLASQVLNWMDRSVTKNAESMFAEEHSKNCPCGEPIAFSEWEEKNR